MSGTNTVNNPYPETAVIQLQGMPLNSSVTFLSRNEYIQITNFNDFFADPSNFMMVIGPSMNINEITSSNNPNMR